MTFPKRANVGGKSRCYRQGMNGDVGLGVSLRPLPRSAYMTWARRGDEIPEQACFPGHPGLRLAPAPQELTDLVNLAYRFPANGVFEGPGTPVMRKGLDGSGARDKGAEQAIQWRRGGALGYMKLSCDQHGEARCNARRQGRSSIDDSGRQGSTHAHQYEQSEISLIGELLRCSGLLWISGIYIRPIRTKKGAGQPRWAGSTVAADCGIGGGVKLYQDILRELPRESQTTTPQGRWIGRKGVAAQTGSQWKSRMEQDETLNWISTNFLLFLRGTPFYYLLLTVLTVDRNNCAEGLTSLVAVHQPPENQIR
ncbi:uncharacterized protein BO96DRAFT_435708 [Aspergillus niger CBS 101883]|uniref:uncharacterized protein n=1 Tax=Aspergillus lacticoffeatus (strain CBS 101883) TaxID=1450533 RepID=UPI000D8022B9|nr:uncharacterized protein BO96DRAFT_435708 [Aspergillus niger CBS 101883]PYH54938.1 hypothetical protein BO96DRAFT_435708 [Aspergillus niger CBS 101883]